MTGQVLLDVAAYSVQLVALVAGAIAVTRSLPVDEPRAELRLWRALLAAAVLLPVAGLFAGAAVRRASCGRGSSTRAWQ